MRAGSIPHTCGFKPRRGLSGSYRTNGETLSVDKCPNTKSVTVFGRNSEQKKALLFNPRCKQWDCPYCAEHNKTYWIHQAMRGTLLITSEGREVQFVTVTSRAYATPYTSLYFFRQNWPKLSRRMKYKTNLWRDYAGKDWAYFLVPERHQSGVLHAHILAATHISSEKIWKTAAWQTGFGYIIDVDEMITPKKAAFYVSKYLTKQIAGGLWPKDFMRVRHSRNWPIAHEKPLEGWRWETYKNDETIWLEKFALIDMGWEVVDMRE